MPVWSERLLGADAPVRGRFQPVTIERQQRLVLVADLGGTDVHPLVAQMRAVRGGDVTRRQARMFHKALTPPSGRRLSGSRASRPCARSEPCICSATSAWRRRSPHPPPPS